MPPFFNRLIELHKPVPWDRALLAGGVAAAMRG
jgi:hypothetical protein